MKESLLISKCLLGQNVRYDGGHCSLSLSDLEKLYKIYNIIEICPEFEAGMGIPRNPIERIGDKIMDQNGNDYTYELERIKDKYLRLVAKYKIKKALLKDESPSCGSDYIYDGSFENKKVKGMGIIAEALLGGGVEVFSEKNIQKLLT